MNIYLPIAEISVNIFMILGLGLATGVLAGMVGVGGGFLLTPLLMFIGVPPAVCVSSVSNQLVATSASGFLAHWRRNNVDFKMGCFLLAGGLTGSTLGVEAFQYLHRLGALDVVVSLMYVMFLGVVGAMMADESIRAILKVTKKPSAAARPKLAMRLPLKVDFPRSKIHISGIMPVAIGFTVGLLVSFMGIGGGLFLIPAMIYLLGMPTNVVIGTSLFEVIFITSNVTLLQAVSTQTVDILLALLLLSGSVIGAQLGSKWGARLPAEYLRALLAALMLAVAAKLAFGLFTPPADVYSVSVLE